MTLVKTGKISMKTPSVIYFLIAVALTGMSCSEPESKVMEESRVTTKEEVAVPAKTKVILFFGNSITAGYGLEISDAFTTLIQARLDSMNAGYEVINAGVSGETTASGANRVKWVLEKQPVDIFVLELGANDGLRGVPVTETRKNLEYIIDRVREHSPDVKIIIAGMMVPPSMGGDYSRQFQNLFPEVAKKKNVALIPFILDNVAGIDTLNLPDGIHPNKTGEKIVAENVWAILKEVI